MITHTDDKKTNTDPKIIRADIAWGIWTGPHPIDESYLIVDKSLWIKELIDNSENKILIIRPRGFGKSSHLRLLCYFFEDPAQHNEKISLFNIWSVDNGHYRQYRGKYSVIYLNFRTYNPTYKDNNFESAIEVILHLINIIAIHYELEPIVFDQDDLSSKKSSLKRCIDQISKKSGKKVILLLDDIDHILNIAIYYGYYEKMVNFFLPFLEQALEDRLQLKKTVMMSTFPLHLYKKLGIRLFGMLDTQFSNHFGFSSQELNAILHEIFTSESVKILYDYIETWHNGYQIGDRHYFCPFHISALIEYQRKRGEYHGDRKAQNSLPKNPLDFLKNYNLYREVNHLDNLLGQNRFLPEFKRLLSNKPIYSKISYKPMPVKKTMPSTKTISNLLLMSGFLTFKKQSDSKYEPSSSLIIPNNMWRSYITDFLETDNELINKWIRLNQYREKLNYIINRQVYLSVICAITIGMILLTVLDNPSNIRILLLLGGVPTSIYFSKLSAADQALIEEISQELYQDIQMNLSDRLTELNKKIKSYSEDHAIENHLSQQQKIAFLSGSHKRIGCLSKLRLSFFNNTLFTLDVVQEIFEFSGHNPKKR